MQTIPIMSKWLFSINRASQYANEKCLKTPTLEGVHTGTPRTLWVGPEGDMGVDGDVQEPRQKE